MPASSDVRTWSFVSLLVGGVLIVTAGLMGGLMGGAWGWMGGMHMGAYVDPVRVEWMSWWMPLVGTVTGGLVLAAAYNVRQSRRVGVWSVIAIAAGALSLMAMGGYVVGAIAAIVGGALGLLEQPPASRPMA